MRFSFEFIPQCGVNWPQVSIALGNSHYSPITVDGTDLVHCDFESNSNKNCLQITYHKTEQETVLENGQIIKDQTIQLNRIWVDDVLMEPWLITEGCYYPQYFQGILDKFPDWPGQLPSQTIWHFPGLYKINFELPFWPWYSSQRKKFSQSNHIDKDNERWENWSGSDNSHQDIVQKIYQLLNV
jgi:hypothetical protein